jgi:hypothetical protein
MIRRALAAVLFGAAGHLALAASSGAGAPPTSSTWQFEATPYLWFAGLSGDVGIGKLGTGGVEASFSDIVSSLHFAAMGAFEGHVDRWGFLLDAIYFDVSGSHATPNGLFGDGDASIKQQLYTGLATYRVLPGDVAVDVFAGPRYANLSADLTLSGGALPARSGSHTVDWWDAVGGARVVWSAPSNWTVTGVLDVGGGGSKFTWEALVGAGYRFNKVVAVKFGYRYISVDYDSGGFLYDMGTAGPYAGAGFRF